MAKLPKNNKQNIIGVVKSLIKSGKFIKAVEVSAAKRGTAFKRMDVRQRDKQADERFGKQREKGLNLNQFLASVLPKIRSNAIRDEVTIVSLKLNKDKTRIRSRSLTYDREHGRVQIRPHKHEIQIVPSSGERYDVKFSRAKRLLFYCDCEYWMFDCEYAMAKRWGATTIKFSNGEFPVEKNPKLAANICKHCYVLMKYVKQEGL